MWNESSGNPIKSHQTLARQNTSDLKSERDNNYCIKQDIYLLNRYDFKTVTVNYPLYSSGSVITSLQYHNNENCSSMKIRSSFCPNGQEAVEFCMLSLLYVCMMQSPLYTNHLSISSTDHCPFIAN